MNKSTKNSKKKLMTKSISTLLAATFVVALLSPASSSIYAKAQKENSIPVIKADDISAVLKYQDGEETELENAPNLEKMEKNGQADELDSYELFYDDEVILEVELSNQVVNVPADDGETAGIGGGDRASASSDETAGIGGGSYGTAGSSADGATAEDSVEIVKFYSSEFTIPETTKQVYITGLLAENIDEIQQLLIDAYVEDETFDITHASFIDTDKTYVDDENLCWAATSSEALYYTGWGQLAGFKSEDEIFDLFVDVYNDEAGNELWGLLWFFNGISKDFLPSQPKENTGNYLPDYPFNSYCDNYDCSDRITDMQKIQNRLREGCAVCLAISGYGDKYGNFSHAVRCGGFINDTSYSSTNVNYYDQLLIVDNEYTGASKTNRTELDNTYTVTSLSASEGFYSRWCISDLYYDDYETICITDYTVLLPYSSSLARETAEDATKDMHTTTDLWANRIYFKNGNDYTNDNVFYTGSDIGASISYYNLSNFNFVGVCSAEYSLTNADGEAVCSGSFDSDFSSILINKIITQDFELSTSALPAGEYTLTVTINPEHSPVEAYYINNTISSKLILIEGDTPAYGISVSISDFDADGNAWATPSFTGLDDMPEGTQYKMYLENKLYFSWLDTGSFVGYELEKLCAPWQVRRLGDTFRMHLEIRMPNMPVIRITSNEIALKYDAVYLTEGASNTGYATDLYANDSALKDGEQFSFTIKNSSTNDAESLDCYYYLQVESTDGTTTDITDKQKLTIAKGETTDEIVFTSWKENLHLQGTYVVYAVVQIEGENATTRKMLSTLRFKEVPGIVVNTGEDISSSFDGLTSLREAVAYYKSQGYTDEAITFDYEKTGDVIRFKKPIQIDSFVKIDGTRTYDDEPYPLFMYFYSDSSVDLFQITASGTLDISGITNGNVGTGFDVDGGELRIDKCVLRLSHVSTGYTIDGAGASISFKDSMLISTSADKYGGINATAGSSLNVINSTFVDRKNINATASPYIEVTDSSANIISSTFVSHKRTAVSSNGGTNMLGCIILNEANTTDVSGEVNLYGCYYGSDDGSATQFDGCQSGQELGDIFKMKNNYVDFEELYSDHTIYYFAYHLHPLMEGGVTLDASGDELSYSYEGESYATSIPKFFAENEYTHDSYGDERVAIYGALNPEAEASISAGMSIDEDLTVQIYGNVIGFANDANITPSITVEFLGKTYTATELKMEGRSCVYEFEGLTPQYMNEDIKITFTCKSGEESISTTKTITVAQYLNALYTYYGNEYAEVSAAILNYGRYSSLYYNANSKEAGEADVSVLTMPSWASAIVDNGYEIPAEALVKGSTKGVLYTSYNTEGKSARISTASLRLGNQIKVILYIKVADTNISELYVQLADGRTYPSSTWTLLSSGDVDVYTIVLDAMSPSEFSNKIEASLIGPVSLFDDEADEDVSSESSNGGAIYNTGSQASGNGSSNGGAIYNDASQASGNNSSNGGAIYNDGSQASGNDSSNGGAIYNTGDGDGEGFDLPDTAVIHTVTYSAVDYCNTMIKSSDATLAGLARAIYIYGVAVTNYKASHK